MVLRLVYDTLWLAAFVLGQAGLDRFGPGYFLRLPTRSGVTWAVAWLAMLWYGADLGLVPAAISLPGTFAVLLGYLLGRWRPGGGGGDDDNDGHPAPLHPAARRPLAA